MWFEDVMKDGMINLVTPVLTIVGGIFALCKWRRDKAVDRAAQLATLRSQFYSFKPDVLLQEMGNSERKISAEGELDEQVKRKSFFSFLAHVCYLRETNVISEKEFCVFKWQIVNILERGHVLNSISGLYSDVVIRKDVDKPFYSLVKFGAMNCTSKVREHYLRLLGENSGQAMLEGELPEDDEEGSSNPCQTAASVTDNKIYRTHLDVLNGIFNLCYMGHMRCSATLPDGNIVWFPEIEINENIMPPPVGKRDHWYNILRDDGRIIKEYGISTSEAWKDHGAKRYVFGKFRAKNRVEYRFLGMFQPVGGNNGIDDREIVRTYERIGTEITGDDIASASGLIKS